MTELENLPNTYIQTIYKEYTEFMRNNQAQQAAQEQEMAEALENGG